MLARIITPVTKTLAIAIASAVAGTLKNEYEVNKIVEEIGNQKCPDEAVMTPIQEAVREVREETHYQKPIVTQYRRDPLMEILNERNMAVRDAYSSDASVLIIENAESYAKPENKEELKNALRHEISGHLKGHHAHI